MQIINRINYDILKRGVPTVIDAVQGESNARVIQLSIFCNGSAFDVSGSVCSLAFSKPDGTSGWYDTMPDGSSAYETSGNVVSVKIAPQVLAVHGEVKAVIRIETSESTDRTTTFPFIINVAEDPAINSPKSENYYKVQTWDDINNVLSNTVMYVQQNLTEPQQEQARQNIGAYGDGSPIVTPLALIRDADNGSAWTDVQITNLGRANKVDPDYKEEDASAGKYPVVMLLNGGVMGDTTVRMRGIAPGTEYNDAVNKKQMDESIYTPRSLEKEQQAQARANIGALSVDDFGKPESWEAITPTIETGYMYQYDGRKVVSDTCACTEIIPVKSGDKFLITSSYGFAIRLVVEFDNNNTFVNSVGEASAITPVTDYEYTVPDGVFGIGVNTLRYSTNPISMQKKSGGRSSEIPVVLFTPQELSEKQKEQVRANIGAAKEGEGGGSAEGAILYTEQDLTEDQQEQARKNIGAASEDDVKGKNSIVGYEVITPNIIVGYIYIKSNDRILYLTGTSAGTPNCSCTEIIPAKSGEKFKISGKYGFNYILITEFDENSVAVSYDEGGIASALTVANDYEYTVPDGVSGIAVSTIDINTNPIVVKKGKYGMLADEVAKNTNDIVELDKNFKQKISKTNDNIGGKAEKSFVYDYSSTIGLLIDILKKGTYNEDVASKIEALENSVYPNALKLTSGLAVGTYTLKYEDANGIVADYLDICTFTLSTSGQLMAYTGLTDINTAPKKATKIGVYDTANTRVGEIALGWLNRFISGWTPTYTFAAISDVHIGKGDSVEDLTNATAYFDANDSIEFAVLCGDAVDNSKEINELETYQSIVANVQTPIYVTMGNHESVNLDTSGEGTDISGNYASISQYFKQNAHPNINQELYYSFEKSGDVFIMLGVYGNFGYGRTFSNEELQWLYETLEANRNKRCFLFHHYFPKNGSGDAVNCYSSDGLKGKQGDVFYSLLRHYKNVIYFHGHSHASFRVQELNKYNTIDKEYGMYSVHIPSLMWTTYPNTKGDAYVKDADTGEGYIIDVYSTGVHLKGRDFEKNKFSPIGTYWLDTTLKQIEAGTFYDETGTISI